MMQPIPHRVVSRVVEGVRVVSIRVVPVGAGLAVPLPGQFVMLWVFGVGEVPMSVSNVGADGSLVFTVQAVGATSTAITESVVGDVIGLRGPFGTSWPLAATVGRDVAIVAGGLGLAPLRLAIDGLIGGELAPRHLTVLVGARTHSRLIYADDLARWGDSGATVRTTVDAADRGWPGAVGTVTALLDREPLRADIAFVCGPEQMMLATTHALLDRGVVARDIFVSLERNMHCGVAHCGRCQLGPLLLCRDGAVVCWDQVADLLAVRGR